MNVGEFFAVDKIQPLVQLFREDGPYLVAVLFLVLAVSLIRSRETVPRLIAVSSFSLSIICFLFGMFVWYHNTPNTLAKNVRYVLIYEVQNAGVLTPALAKVELPLKLDEWARVYAAPESSEGIYFIVTSPNPISDESINAIFLYTKDSRVPIVFCPAGAKGAQQVQVVSRALPQGTGAPFAFQVMDGSAQWKDLQCPG
jgi:hypothetical protein